MDMITKRIWNALLAYDIGFMDAGHLPLAVGLTKQDNLYTIITAQNHTYFYTEQRERNIDYALLENYLIKGVTEL